MNRRTLLGWLGALVPYCRKTREVTNGSWPLVPDGPGTVVPVDESKPRFRALDPGEFPDERLMHAHDWQRGPFSISATADRYWPPNLIIPVEHCRGCGLLRLPEGFRAQDGDVFNQPKPLRPL